jgi:HEAT repeat protein
MKPNLKNAALATGAALAAASSSAADNSSVDDLIAKLRSPDDKVRTEAWQSAGDLGAPAVRPLANLMSDSELEVARAAKRGLWRLVHQAGRPGAEPERKAVLKELIGLLEGPPVPVRREALWMLSEIGDSTAVTPVADLLKESETREDARAALERIPGEESVEALQAGLASVPEEFKPAIANSLRVRGVKVSGYPSQKLTPTRPVTPGGAKSM